MKDWKERSRRILRGALYIVTACAVLMLPSCARGRGQSGIANHSDAHSAANDAAHSAVSPVTVLGFEETYGSHTIDFPDVVANMKNVTVVSPISFSLTASGRVSGVLPSDTSTRVRQLKEPLWVGVNNVDARGFDASMVSHVLGSRSSSAELVGSLMHVADEPGVTGVNIDFEELPAADGPKLMSFLSSLAKNLHAKHKLLSVDIPAVTTEASAAATAYNEHTIGGVADSVVLMTYDYSYPGGSAGPVAPLWWVREVLSYTVSQIPAKKILLGIPMYGYEWVDGRTFGHKMTVVGRIAAEHHVHPLWDAKDEAPYFTYVDGKGNHTVYYEDDKSIGIKLDLAKQYHVGGIALWHLGTEDSGVWKEVGDYRRGAQGQ